MLKDIVGARNLAHSHFIGSFFQSPLKRQYQINVRAQTLKLFYSGENLTRSQDIKKFTAFPNSLKSRQRYFYVDKLGAGNFPLRAYSSPVVNKSILQVLNKIQSGNNFYLFVRINPAKTKSGKYFPSEFNLSQNYPNPLGYKRITPSTTIQFSIPQAGNAIIEICDALGEKVTTLLNKFLAAGKRQLSFRSGATGRHLILYCSLRQFDGITKIDFA